MVIWCSVQTEYSTYYSWLTRICAINRISESPGRPRRIAHQSLARIADDASTYPAGRKCGDAGLLHEHRTSCMIFLWRRPSKNENATSSRLTPSDWPFAVRTNSKQLDSFGSAPLFHVSPRFAFLWRLPPVFSTDYADSADASPISSHPCRPCYPWLKIRLRLRILAIFSLTDLDQLDERTRKVRG